MILGKWVDPNLEFNATDEQGQTYQFCCYAVSEDELRKRLVGQGLTVTSIKPYDFSEWKKKARKATDKAIWQRLKDRWSHFQSQAHQKWSWLSAADVAAVAGDKKELAATIQKHDGCSLNEAVRQIDEWSATLVEEQPVRGQIGQKTAINFSAGIWQELKWHLFELFHGKCAYCEHKPQAGYPGDVEHYRPKGKVDEDPNHPGYYWLAYDETNLLPSCSRCNQPPTAKRTRFPVDGVHSRDSRNISAEKPLLLNPYDRKIDPFEHLEFAETGVSQARNKSSLGETSRVVYHLDRYGLPGERLAVIKLVEQDWNLRIVQKNNIVAAYQELREEILKGERQYAAAQLWELSRLWKRTVEGLQLLPAIGAPATNSRN